MSNVALDYRSDHLYATPQRPHALRSLQASQAEPADQWALVAPSNQTRTVPSLSRLDCSPSGQSDTLVVLGAIGNKDPCEAIRKVDQQKNEGAASSKQETVSSLPEINGFFWDRQLKRAG